MIKQFVLLILVISLLQFHTGTAQSNSNPLPLDPAVRTGKLSNGFTYYIRKNTEPPKRAQLYLVNKVGSIVEDDDQRGLAHFMEHMNFNGTKNFPKNALVDYLEKAGVKFGADLNAYTSFEETVYQLPIPTEDAGVFNKGIQIMRDWAQGATLDVTEIEKERGVILEEKRLGMGAGERLQRKYLPMLLNHSRYADRLPIGTDDVLNNFKPEVLRRYYTTWYRPNLQALIVVGDINVDAVEKKIKLLFSDLKNPAAEKKRIKYAIPLTGKNQFISLTDKEITATQLQVIIKHQALPLTTADDYRKAILRSLFNQMLTGRYSELAQQADPPFVSSSANLGNFLGGVGTFSVNIILKPGREEAGFKAAWRETQRAKQFGFTATELERAKKSYMSYMASALKEKDKSASVNLVNEYMQLFLTGEAAPGIEYEYKLAGRNMNTITVAEVNVLATTYIKDTDRDILLMAPEKVKTNLPQEAMVLQWMQDVAGEKLSAYVDNISDEPLLNPNLTAGKIVNEKNITEIGAIEYSLSNGIKVIVRPSDFKNDEILFRAYSPGGTSLYNDADYPSATDAAGIINSFGIGNFSASQLQKKLSGKRVNVSPFISERTEGFLGAATPQDLETALQLVHLYFTAPRKDTAMFRNIIERSAVILANRYNDPNNVFGDTVSAVLGSYNYRRFGPTVERLRQIELDKLYEIYKERFADAGDFTFLFTGSIDVNTLKPLIEKYLGSLPFLKRNETAKDLGITTPPGKITKVIYKGTENKATVRMVYSGNLDYNQQNVIALSALSDILQIKLTERLREVEGGVYSPSVRASSQKYPIGRYSITISFGCSPANVEKLIGAAEEEISKLKDNGATAQDLQKFAAEQQRSWENNMKSNAYWISYMFNQYQNDEDPSATLHFPDALKKVNSETVRDAAKIYMNGENVIVFKLLPEK